MNFFQLYFLLTIPVWAFIIYRFFKNRPLKEKLDIAQAELKTEKTINELLSKEIPTSADSRVAAINAKRTADKRD
jgi:hypothetical protein